MDKPHEKFTVSQWAILIRGDKVLILRSAKLFNVGTWELPGGRIEVDELILATSEQALRREIKEELGFDNFEVLAPIDWVIGYNLRGIPSCRLLYLIKNDTDNIVLSDEHNESKWVGVDELSSYRFADLQNTKKITDILRAALQKYGK